MSLQIQDGNNVYVKFQNHIKSDSTFIIRKEADFLELTKKIFISQEDQNRIKSSINLKKRSICLIYMTLPNEELDYCIREATLVNSEIWIKLFGIQCPGIRDNPEHDAQILVLNIPKKYDTAAIKIIFDEPYTTPFPFGDMEKIWMY